MSASYTYSTLVTALQSFTEEYGDEYLTAIDTIIPLAESKLVRDLQLEFFETTTTANLSNASPFLSKPGGMVAERSLFVTDSDSRLNLVEKRSWDFVRDYWPRQSTTTDIPKYYCEYSSSQWFFAGTPNATRTVTIRYIARPTGLSSGNTSTWFGTYCGDLLLYACLLGSERYLKADDRVQVWAAEYERALAQAKIEFQHIRRIDYSPVKATPNP